jgi:hypothetical protein
MLSFVNPYSLVQIAESIDRLSGGLMKESKPPRLSIRFVGMASERIVAHSETGAVQKRDWRKCGVVGPEKWLAIGRTTANI